MPLTDFPQSILFIVFLLLFLVVGIYPTWKKSARLLRETLRKGQPTDKSDTTDQSIDKPVEMDAELQQSAEMNDFEVFILRRLAQERNKALSRRQINATLHFEPVILKSTLKSLVKKGLLRVNVGYLSGIRYYLSASGRNYAIDCGYIPSIHKQAG